MKEAKGLRLGVVWYEDRVCLGAPHPELQVQERCSGELSSTPGLCSPLPTLLWAVPQRFILTQEHLVTQHRPLCSGAARLSF